MEFEKKWEKIDELGAGGQGQVWIVRDKDKFQLKPNKLTNIMRNLDSNNFEVQANFGKKFKEEILKIINSESHDNWYALKIMRKDENARDTERAPIRFNRAINTLETIDHPNIIKIIDKDPDNEWYVMPYYSNKSLANYQYKYHRNFMGALTALRPVIEGVALLHKDNFVHRDIKPENILIDNKDSLVLTDFDLIYSDAEENRISGTYSNVGTRDFLAPWAQGVRQEQPDYALDVFALGKVLYCMITGKPKCPFYYFDDKEHPDFSLSKIASNMEYIALAKNLIGQCIVERRGDCLPDASALLIKVDKALEIMTKNSKFPIELLGTTCRMCSIGTYDLIIDEDDNDGIKHLGLNPIPSSTTNGKFKFKIYRCNNCAHTELFTFGWPEPDIKFPAWEAKKQNIL